MSRWHSWLRSATEMLSGYKGDEPFPFFAKQYFSQHKQAGSKDRRHISELCYRYFRTARAFPGIPLPERILTGYFLCHAEPNEQLAAFHPTWNDHIHLSLSEKLNLLDTQVSMDDFFPDEILSDTIDKEKLIASLFRQPDLFLRLRPGFEETVKQKLEAAAIPFIVLSPSALSLPNASRIDKLIDLDKEAVVQDLNSQRVGELLLDSGRSFSNAWDCCTGSGGKSILLHDLIPNIHLTVSDNRPSILQNLGKRFYAAGISRYKCIKTNLSLPADRIKENFDLILADVPCTGSGTWGRTPEQLYYFEKKKIDEYTEIQKKILSNVIPRLVPGGCLLYITCSVFKKENEEITDFIREKFGLQAERKELLSGYDKKADTMYAVLLKQQL